MIERLNGATNILAFALVAMGALLSVWHPEVGKDIVIGGLGVFGGGQLAKKEHNENPS